MKRNLFRLGSALVAALTVAACTDDPTEALRTGAAHVVTSLSYVEILVGDELQGLTAQTTDPQGNALSALPRVTTANPLIADVAIDSVQSGKPTPRRYFSIAATGYGTTVVTADLENSTLFAEINVQTWPASVRVTAAELGGQVVSGTPVQLTATPVGTDGVAVTGDPIEVFFTSNDATTATVDSATGLVATKSTGLASFIATTITDRIATGTGSFEVIPQVFAGTTSANSGTGGQLITVTQAAGGEPFDANTAVTIVPDDITVDPVAATITAQTATTLTFPNPISTTTTLTGSAVISNVGPSDVSQAFDFDAVGPFAFDGTVSSTSVTVGDVITVTAGATYPWDGDETFTVGGMDVDPLFIISQDLTSATFVVQIPVGGADGSAELLTINNQGPSQIQSGIDIDVAPYAIPDDPTTAPDITAGPFPFVFYATVGGGIDDAFWKLDGLGYTVTIEWANSADIDILWYDGDGGRYYFNFDGATGANPEVSGYSAADYLADPPPNGAVLNADMYDDHGNGQTLMKITVTQP